ncbi:MAG TPA: hydroxysqualene dehydroxylase HpnE [Bryobacteraceae bacterium]|nr:hydroxysqualene dehydroxylase HpnE [Bryobacteraceae bacterium]
MAEVIVIGGGMAGLAAAAALGGAGHSVKVLESRPFLGGRATSYEVGNGEEAEFIDNCQHILLRCCVNLLDFYERLGVEQDIAFSREFTFIEPGGRRSVLRSGMLPAPAHFAESFLKLSFLNFSEKVSVGRAIQAVGREIRRTDLDRISMLDWLKEQRQPPRAIERFWRQVLVSAINEELDRMAAAHGLQVFRLGFLARKDAYEMGVPNVPLGRLYSGDAWKRIGGVELCLRNPVSRVVIEENTVRGVLAGEREVRGDYFVCALPFERVNAVAPELGVDVREFEHSPITGIHLWFDRPVTDLPHATLLDRTMQWMFNKHEGRYVQLVVSASRSLSEMPRAEVIALALKELGEFFPAVREAKLEKAHVVKEIRATFSAKPGLEAHRPGNRTKVGNLFLAGDWTKSGWPATMEGAVRSGYLAAEAVSATAGAPQKFLKADIA